MENKTLEMSLLLDFYGDLLTEKQREYIDYYYNDDLSLAEIADNVGITRQGVRDIIVRAEAILTETERKTGLVKKFTELERLLSEAASLADKIEAVPESAADMTRLREILTEMKG